MKRSSRFLSLILSILIFSNSFCMDVYAAEEVNSTYIQDENAEGLSEEDIVAEEVEDVDDPEIIEEEYEHELDETQYEAINLKGCETDYYSSTTYVVSFYANGGTAVSDTLSVTVGEAYGPLPTTTRTGYTFEGWYTEKTGGIKQESTSTLPSANNQMLYAHWTPNTYTITYDANGGSVSGSGTKEVTYGGTYGLLAMPVRPGYSFDGWFTSAEGGSQIISTAKVNLTSDQTLYAHWTEIKYRVSFDANGGSVVSLTFSVSIDEEYGTLPTTEREGCTFDGWYTEREGGIKQEATSKLPGPSDQVLYAHWIGDTYTISFDGNGGILSGDSSKDIEYGNPYGTLPTATREGYVFAGWFTGATDGVEIDETTEVAILENHTIYAHWTPNTYTVTFDGNGGIVSDEDTKDVVYDSTYGSLPVATKSGYGFEGWFTSAEGGTEITSETKVEITSDQTLYAHWGAEKFTVQFDSNGGSEVDDILSVEIDEAYGDLPITIRPGYTFEGWYTEKEEGIKQDENSKLPDANNQVLYAHWTANTYTITFDGNGGTVSGETTKEVTYDSTYGTLATATKDGMIFEGWYTDPSDGEKVNSDSKVEITDDQTLYAHWVESSFTVYFDANGGNVDTAFKSIFSGDTYGDLPEPTRLGYKFIGWYTSATDGSLITKDSKLPKTDSETLYAHWSANTYLITFDGNGGVVAGNTTKSVTYGSPYGLLPNATQSGKILDGWYTSPVGGDEITSDDTVLITGNLKLYAHWCEKKYTINFDANGGEVSVSSKKITSGTTYGTLPVPTRAGYTFNGWYTASNGGYLITKDSLLPNVYNQTLYARWTANMYLIRYDGHGGVVTGETSKFVTYDKPYGKLASATKEGYIFDGWYTSEVGGTKIDEKTYVSTTVNQILHAHWKGEEFVLSFDTCGGDTIDNIPVNFDSPYGELPVPSKAGAKFLGWYTEKEGGTKVADEDVYLLHDNQTLYAHWELKFTLASPVFVDETIEVIDENYVVHKGSKVKLVSNVNGAKIYYTIDGTSPLDSDTSILYDDEIEITDDLIIKAFAEKDGYISSDVVERSYVIKDESSEWGEICLEDQAGFADANAVSKNLWVSMTGSVDYTGKAITFDEDDLHVYHGKKLLSPVNDYTVKYANNIKAGTATVTITGKNNYSGTIIKNFKIEPLDITSAEADDIYLAFNNRVQKGTTPVTYNLNGVPTTLKANTDFTFVYPGTNAKEEGYSADAFKAVGNHTIQIVGKGNYKGTKIINENITDPKIVTLISKLSVRKVVNKTYTGEEIKQNDLEVWNGKVKLTEGEDADYTLEYEDNVEIGTATVRIIGHGKYIGTKAVTFKITGASINKMSVEYTNFYYYDGTEKKPEVAVYMPSSKANPVGMDLVEDIDYKVSYENNVNAGKKATIIITGINAYTGTIKKTFTIAPKFVDELAITIGDAVYNKSGSKPSVTVDDYAKPLDEGVDYTIAYSNNTKIHNGEGAKAPTVKITGKGNYGGYVLKTYAISPSSMSNVSISATDITYQNKAGLCRPVIKLVDSDGKALLAGTDYEKSITYKYVDETMVSQLVDAKNKIYRYIVRGENAEVELNDIIPVGTEIRAFVTGKGNYPGTKEVTFRYISVDLSKAVVNVEPQLFTGKEVRPSKADITVKIGNTIIDKCDYEIVGYSNNISKGNGILTLRGVGNCGGTKTVNFTIGVRSMNYTVVYVGNADGVTGSMKNSVTALNSKVSANVFKRPNYKFAGWSFEPGIQEVKIKNSGVLVLDEPAEYGSKIYLYAQWKR